MSSKHQYFLSFLLPLLLLLLFSFLSLKSLSWRISLEEDYQKWVMWNVKSHHQQRRMLLLGSEPNNSTVVGLKKEDNEYTQDGFDLKLKNAEMNQVRISVCQNGTGDYANLKDALSSISLHYTHRVILDIKPGIYREKIYIPRTMPFITFMGDSTNPPIITGNDTASVTGSEGKPLKTFQSATVAVDADYFLASNIVFENTAPHQIGNKGEQAVALRISGTKAAFYNCSFYGSQDTLYDHKGLHYFNHCFIQGSVDFIFGYGRSLYENCTLNSITTKVASLTAQKRTDSSLESGFSFKDCKVTGSGHAYLGRAWGDHSRVVFSYTFLDKLVLPQGWSDWHIKSHANWNVYYGEYRCSGPGANMTERVPWARALTAEEVEPFIGTYYIEGDTWLINPNS
ncbi:hypothetical protein Dimus_016699 [Dionaea muscipula]